MYDVESPCCDDHLSVISFPYISFSYPLFILGCGSLYFAEFRPSLPLSD